MSFLLISFPQPHIMLFKIKKYQPFTHMTNSVLTSEKQTLSFNDYLQTVRSVWIGKFIGGTLGAPLEGWKRLNSVDVDQDIPTLLAENDDTDLQILWVHALEEHGIHLTSQHLLQEWMEHVRAPWGEYGIAFANWERGILPPDSGRIDNWFFGNGMGCPIRSEIWGMICPGAPQLAARYAEMDAQLDHIDCSVEAEKFLAAMEASLFFEKDIHQLIKIGKSVVDPKSRFLNLIDDVLSWSDQYEWQQVRHLILIHYGHPDMTNSLQNMGFILLGLLKGNHDFSETLNISLNCGYDSDCTAATAGAILAGILGYDNIPAKWRDAVPDEYLISDWMQGFPKKGTITALSNTCCHFGLKIAEAFETDITFTDVPNLSPEKISVTPHSRPVIKTIQNPFPTWTIIGPFWRQWDEVKAHDPNFPDHGTESLPSCLYMFHRHPGFDENFIEPESIESFLDNAESKPFRRIHEAEDSRVPFHSLPQSNGPCCYYAYTTFKSTDSKRIWLMVGSAGPIQVWLNGKEILLSEKYQMLTPSTYPIDTHLIEGTNSLLLKVAHTSQPLGSSISIKNHNGRHSHQCFYDTSIEWLK